VKEIALSFDETRTRSSFVLGPPLLRHDGSLYGGTAIAASIMVMEAATQRGVLWVTTQFVAPSPSGQTLELHCETLAAGKRIAQVRVTATLDGAIQFASLGSAGLPREGGLEGQFEAMPVVSPPEDSSVLVPGPPGAVETPDEPTFRRLCEYREAEISQTTRDGSGTVAFWSRFKDGRPMTRAGVAFCADMVPLSIARGAGKLGAGTSLDNSLRFGEVGNTEWVLLELQGNMASGGYGHGTVRVWSQDGRQIAVGSQTASMIYVFDPNDDIPMWPPKA
jgi:acyl-CoA thioesterase